MSDKSHIEWTDATWNPIVGCSIVSPGCTNCYAMKLAGRRLKNTPKYNGLTQGSKSGPVWNGQVRLWEKALLDPLHWRKGRKIFVNSEGDLFHESIPDEWIDRAFAVMALCERHTFQILTKRADRIKSYINRWFMRLAESNQIFPHPAGPTKINAMFDWAVMPSVLPNVWLGVSTERQQEADERILELQQTPAAVRFVSAEPLLGPIDFDRGGFSLILPLKSPSGKKYPCIDWVIVGGESGPGARRMDARWVSDIRDQCAMDGVPFFFKQWGAHDPFTHDRVGKKSAGRLLDGKEYSEFPRVSAA